MNKGDHAMRLQVVTGKGRTGAADSSSLYKVVKNADAHEIAENMCELSETILTNEKENAKSMLEKLWKLKNTLHKSENHEQIDQLIQHYQRKIDALRKKEEAIRTTSQKAKELFEEKQNKETQISRMSDQINNYGNEISTLTQKRRRLMLERDKLTQAQQQLLRELDTNQEHIVSGLYTIITAGSERFATAPHAAAADSAAGVPPDTAGTAGAQATQPPAAQEATTAANETPAAADTRENTLNDTDDDSGADTAPGTATRDMTQVATGRTSDEAAGESTGTPDEIELFSASAAGPKTTGHTLYQQKEVDETPRLPKSIVKTTGNVVIGEYFYEPTVVKHNRHYVFNSAFFADQVYKSTNALQRKFDRSTYNQMLHIIQDAYKRITKNDHIHFEIATNELINENTLKDAWYHAKKREYDAIVYFCRRINAKIDALGTNYQLMRKEQLQRYKET